MPFCVHVCLGSWLSFWLANEVMTQLRGTNFDLNVHVWGCGQVFLGTVLQHIKSLNSLCLWKSQKTNKPCCQELVFPNAYNYGVCCSQNFIPWFLSHLLSDVMREVHLNLSELKPFPVNSISQYQGLLTPRLMFSTKAVNAWH